MKFNSVAGEKQFNLTVSHFSMRVDDAVGLFWGQRVGWDMPLAHVGSESEAVERAEWSVRRSEFRREARSKLGGFTLALPFVSDHRDDRHLGDRHVRRTSRLSSSPQSALQLLHVIEIRQNKRGSVISTSVVYPKKSVAEVPVGDIYERTLSQVSAGCSDAIGQEAVTKIQHS